MEQMDRYRLNGEKQGGQRKKGKGCVVGCMTVILAVIGILAAILVLADPVDTSEKIVNRIRESQVPFSEVDISEKETADGYYYQYLTEEEQTIYKELWQGVRENQESIYVHTGNTDRIVKIYRFLLNDRPELFWCTGEVHIYAYDTYSEVQPVYTYSEEEKLEKQAEIDAAVTQCLSGIYTDASEYDRVKYIFEYLVNSIDYDMEAPDNQNIYSALVLKRSVCAGYSRAAQYLLSKLGVECIYVTGEVPEQGAHAWNIVKCNEKYYYMDVTFADPVFLEAESGKEIPPSTIQYGYLCCTDAEILKNHTLDTDVSYPACTSMDLNYYMLNDMYYETYDSYTVLQKMNQCVYEGAESFTCKFAGDEVYNQAHDDMIQNLIPQAAQNLVNYYGLSSVWYTYQEDPVLDVITVYWQYEEAYQ